MTLLTEDEAKAKLCPYSFARNDESDQYDRGIRQGGPWNCIASDCMAWRVAQKEIRREKTDAAIERSFRQAHGAQVRIEPHNWPSSGYDSMVVDARGYCGAFGTVSP